MIIKKFETKEQWLDMRLDVITSTEVSALFGLNPYITEFELWHQKKNRQIVLLEDNDRMRWGSRLEPVIAEGIAEDNPGWMVDPFKDFAVHDEIKAGSSFDYLLAIPSEEGTSMIEGLLEIKKVDELIFKDKWSFDGDKKAIATEAPPHIELQVQHQLMITGHPFCYIGVLIGGNRAQLIKRTPQEKIISAIKSKIIKFWNTIEHNIEPRPDFEKDAEFIAKMHGYAEPNKVMDVTDPRMDELALQYKEASEVIKQHEIKKKAIKAEILTLIGDNEKAFGDKYIISAGVTGPTKIEAHERSGFRNFRIHFQKEK